MKRVQVILEEWQHQWLSDQSKLESSSISALLRQLLTEAIEQRQTEGLQDDPIWGIVGLAKGPNDGVSSENLDQYIYRPDWHDRPTLKVTENEPGDS